MIYAGIKTSVKKGMEERARHWHFRDAGTDTIGGFSQSYYFLCHLACVIHTGFCGTLSD